MIIPATSLFLYLLGGLLQLLVNAGILLKLEYKEKPGLLLILSLGVSDIWASILGSIGSLSSLVGDFILLSPDVLGFTMAIGWAVSTFHIMALAFNRLIGIVFDHKYETYCSSRRTLYMAGCSWFLGITYAVLVPVLGWPAIWSLELCHTTWDMADGNATSVESVYAMSIIVQGAVIVWPAISYMIISIKLCKHVCNPHMGDQSAIDLTLCGQFFIISFACIANIIMWNMISFTPSLANWPLANIMTVFGGLAVTTCNPYVYLVFNKPVRKAVKQVICPNVTIAPGN